MAKGSVRKKGKKWYYRFYVEDASGNLVQKEFAGTENKSETEKLLRQAMEDYEAKRFVAKAENITLGELLDLWAEEELKTGTLSNGTVGNYLQTIGRIKQHPISKRKLKTVTSVHLQEFMDLLLFGGTVGDFISKGYSIDYVRSFSAVLQQSFRFAVFPKQFITFNPMQYVVMRHKKEETDLFADETATDRDKVKPLSFEMYRKLIEQLGKRSGDAILPVQIAYFTGLRLGEVAGLTWQDINLEEQYLTVRRSIRYNGAIEAKGAEYISGNKITIEDCTYIEKNHRILEKNGKYRKINQEKISLSDRVSIFLFVVAIISILVTIGCFALLKDYFDEENSYIDNIISEIGLVFAIVSTKYVRSFIERITMRPRILKKLTICIFVLLAPFYINALFALLGISQTISNCISVVGIILSLLSYE